MKIQVHNKIRTNNLTMMKISNLTKWFCNEIMLPVATLDIIFTDDENLRDLHETYLDDKNYTDVMTFNLGTDSVIEGEIYISNERARENSLKFDVALEVEICRLIIHACLHLAGYKDNNKANRSLMKEKEEKYLSLVSNNFLN